MQPSTNWTWSFSISPFERHVPIARRNPSEPAGVKPATSIAIFITCSWYRITPRVSCRIGARLGWR